MLFPLPAEFRRPQRSPPFWTPLNSIILCNCSETILRWFSISLGNCFKASNWFWTASSCFSRLISVETNSLTFSLSNFGTWGKFAFLGQLMVSGILSFSSFASSMQISGTFCFSVSSQTLSRSDSSISVFGSASDETSSQDNRPGSGVGVFIWLIWFSSFFCYFSIFWNFFLVPNFRQRPKKTILKKVGAWGEDLWENFSFKWIPANYDFFYRRRFYHRTRYYRLSIDQRRKRPFYFRTIWCD